MSKNISNFAAWPKQDKMWQVSAVINRIVIVGTLTRWVWLHSVLFEKICFMSLNWEATKNICGPKSEGTFNYSLVVTRWLKKFHSGYKKSHSQEKLGRPQTVDSAVVLQARESNPASSIRRVSGELDIRQCRVFRYPHEFNKNIWARRIVHHVNKILKNIWFSQLF